MLTDSKLRYFETLLASAKSTKCIDVKEIVKIAKRGTADFDELLRNLNEENIEVIDNGWEDDENYYDDKECESELDKQIEFNKNNTAFDLYLNEIDKYSLLSPNEEANYCHLIKDGIKATKMLNDDSILLSTSKIEELKYKQKAGDEARDQMALHNTRLVVRIAKGFRNKGLDLEDLVSYGNFGLLRAVDGFDSDKGYRFSTYASKWITQSIQRGIASSGRSVKLPVHMVDNINKMYNIERKIALELGRDLTNEELSLEMGMTLRQVNELKNYAMPVASLDNTIDSDDDATLSDLVCDDNTLSAEEYMLMDEQTKLIHKALDHLPLIERQIVKYKNGFVNGKDYSFEEVGKILNINREKARKLYNTAIEKMRNECAINR